MAVYPLLDLSPCARICAGTWHPYLQHKPDRWRLALLSAGITHTFSTQHHFGTPIANPPPLTYTFIPDNLRSADINPIYMDNFIQQELDAKQFDSPFMVQEAQHF